MLEHPVLLPFLEWQRSGPAIGFTHRLDVAVRVGEKALPLLGMIARICTFDAEQFDERLAVFLLSLAAEVAQGTFEISRQVGDAGLNHWIDDAFRREKRKSECGVIPHGSVEARVPRG